MRFHPMVLESSQLYIYPVIFIRHSDSFRSRIDLVQEGWGEELRLQVKGILGQRGRRSGQVGEVAESIYVGAQLIVRDRTNKSNSAKCVSYGVDAELWEEWE